MKPRMLIRTVPAVLGIAGPILITPHDLLTRVYSVVLTTITSAVAGDRYYAVQVTDANDNLISLWPYATAAQAASTTRVRIFMRDWYTASTSTTTYLVGVIPDVWLPAESKLRVINLSGGDNGDSLGETRFLIEEI